MPEIMPMIDVPDIVRRGQVRAHLVSFMADGPDDGQTPDEQPLSGYVTLTPTVSQMKWPTAVPPRTAVIQTLRCPVLDGWLYPPGTKVPADDPGIMSGVWVVATEQPEGLPDRVQWRASFELVGVKFQPSPVTFDVPDRGTVDLTTVLPAVPDPGVIVVVSTVERERAEAAAVRAEGFRDAAQGHASAASVSAGEAEGWAGDADTAKGLAVEAQGAAEGYASAAQASAASVALHGQIQWDETAGRYTNESIQAFFAARSTLTPYGVQIPKGLATECEKTGANAGIPNPVPSTLAAPGSDPYTAHSPFTYIEVNGGVEEDGTPFVTAIQGDTHFQRDGSNGDVWVMAPILFWDFVDEGDDMHLRVTDSPLAGFEPQPKAFLPSGERRPYALYAKYPLSQVDGVARSVSGQPTLTRTVSHNTLLTICQNSATGHSGKSFADDWYVKVMFLLKYATKNSQSAYSGASSYNVYGDAVAAGTNTNQITVASSVGSQVLPLSWISLGTNLPASTNRSDTQTYDVFDARRVESVEDIGGGQTVITVDGPPFNVESGNRIVTMPWGSGSCDGLTSDGSPYNPVSSREPFMVQGIEIMHGAYEILGDVILANTGDGWRPRTVLDSRNASTDITAHYTDTGIEIPTTDNTWQYSAYPNNGGGLLFGDGLGGSSTTGMADGTYINPISTIGTRQWLSLGYLTLGSPAGLWYLYGNVSLGFSHWYFASRLSAMGRGGEAA